MRGHALDIFNTGIAAVTPETCIRQFVKLRKNHLIIDAQPFDLNRFDHIFVIGAGKASAAMAGALEQICGPRISKGVVVSKYGHGTDLNRIKLFEAGHPIPDENGVKAAIALRDLALQADARTLVVCLISGGGSALLPLPADGLSLSDIRQTSDILIGCGAGIHEINTIRKHLSGLTGGRLARAVHPATMACLVISDVVGDDLDTIASGPAVPDPSSFSDCSEIMTRLSIRNKLPEPVQRHLEKGTAKKNEETPKKGDACFSNIFHFIIADNSKALFAAARKADALGYQTQVLSAAIQGDTLKAAQHHTDIAKKILLSQYPLHPPACVLSGGETTVVLNERRGRGGRNQHFALACLELISGLDHCVVLSGGTDGTDGPTDAAGAMVDSSSLDRASAMGLDPYRYLKDCRSYAFFDKTGELIKTGPTRTNVMDLRVILIQ